MDKEEEEEDVRSTHQEHKPADWRQTVLCFEGALLSRRSVAQIAAFADLYADRRAGPATPCMASKMCCVDIIGSDSDLKAISSTCSCTEEHATSIRYEYGCPCGKQVPVMRFPISSLGGRSVFYPAKRCYPPIANEAHQGSPGIQAKLPQLGDASQKGSPCNQWIRWSAIFGLGKVLSTPGPGNRCDSATDRASRALTAHQEQL